MIFPATGCQSASGISGFLLQKLPKSRKIPIIPALNARVNDALFSISNL
jgi:hypothetical protein